MPFATGGCILSLIQIVHQQSEQKFLSRIEEYNRHKVGHGVLVCGFSATSLRMNESEVLFLLTPILQDYQAEIYLCEDGDIAISWSGKFQLIREQIAQTFLATYPQELDLPEHPNLFRFFDSQVQAEELRFVFQSKLHRSDIIAVDIVPPPPPAYWNQRFTDQQLNAMKRAIGQRPFRKKPEILVVEDQAFSRKLLTGLFEKDYRTHSAENAEQAAAIYAERAPEVVFLDVELPDVSGHTLASLIKRYDPQSYIVMVTANNYAKDVEAAKDNKVQGFIVKPYSKQKVMNAFDIYLQQRTRKS